MNRILAPLAAAALALTALSPSAQAGGSGDFYKHLKCAINSSGTANLDITNYDIRTGQRYHMDMDAPSGYQPQGLYVDGVKQGGWNDRYKDFSNPTTNHEIKGVWLVGAFPYAAAVSCHWRL